MKPKPDKPKYRNLYAWRGSIWYERVVGGRRYKVDTETTSWDEAAHYRDLYEENKGIRRAGVRRGAVPIFRELALRYYEGRKFSRLAATTQQDRRSHLSPDGSVMQAIGGRRVDEITADMLVEWWERQSRANSWNVQTGFRYLSSIAEVLRAGRRYLVGPLPTIEARQRIADELRTAAGRASVRARVRPIEDPAAIARLLEAARSEGPEVYVFAVALIDTGARKGELRALRWRCVAWGADQDDPRRHVRIEKSRSRGANEDGTTKSGRGRGVGMSRRLRAALGDLYLSRTPRPSGDDLVFPSLDDKTLGQAWRRITAAADLPGVVPKDCRDTFASHLLTAGFPIQWVSRQLGHGSTHVTEKHYARYLGHGGEDFLYVEPAHLEPGDVPADVLARLEKSPQTPHKGDPFALPGFLQSGGIALQS